jgi:rhodanese-related sulfurtransferase
MFKPHLKGLLAAICLLPTFTAIADGLDGNRYSQDLERRYTSEISAASAYLATKDNGRAHRHGFGKNRGPKAVIIDVRTIEEYKGGHPPGAYNIPYPHIYNRQHSDSKPYAYIPQTGENFVDAVNALGLGKDTMIITMCRTGYRSVGAGNLLADAGYTNVHNMWQGFKGKVKTNESSEMAARLDEDGNPLVDEDGNLVLIQVLGQALDLDGDGVVNGSDPYSGDLDGWANYQGLPVSYKLKHNLLYPEYINLYYDSAVVGER